MAPTRITRDDALNAILETNENLTTLSISLARLEERFVAMDTANQERNQTQDTALQEKLSAIHTELSDIKAYETSCPVSTIGDDVAALKKYHEEYPSLPWLFRHRTRMMFMWTMFGVSLLILAVAPWADRKVLGALLKFSGLPDPIVDIIIGKP